MTKIGRFKTNRLFRRLTVLDGMGSVFNVVGNYYNFNYSNSGEEADRKAIENDWGVIGDDIRGVAGRSNKELAQFPHL
jgi:hypothetical protein